MNNDILLGYTVENIFLVFFGLFVPEKESMSISTFLSMDLFKISPFIFGISVSLSSITLLISLSIPFDKNLNNFSEIDVVMAPKASSLFILFFFQFHI